MHVSAQLVSCIGKYSKMVFDSVPILNRRRKSHHLFVCNFRFLWLFNRCLSRIIQYTLAKTEKRFKQRCSYIFSLLRIHCEYESKIYLGQNCIHVRHSYQNYFGHTKLSSTICQLNEVIAVFCLRAISAFNLKYQVLCNYRFSRKHYSFTKQFTLINAIFFLALP